MSDTKIEWTDKTWSPIRARVRADAPEIARSRGWHDLATIAEAMLGRIGPHCEQVSPGCHNCYSKTNNHRRLPSNGTGLPFDKRSRELVEIFMDERILSQPLRWRKPAKIFVENQSDLFGEFVPDEYIAAVFGVMAVAHSSFGATWDKAGSRWRDDWRGPHTFQVLTKRPGRMSRLLRSPQFRTAVARSAFKFAYNLRDAGYLSHQIDCKREWERCYEPGRLWPLPNVWMGVSCEDQQRAGERIPDLLATPAAVRFVSVEPMLGPIDLRQWTLAEHGRRAIGEHPGISWVIVGGESGPGARPMHPQWVRSIRDQCQAAGVSFFFKQWGEWAPDCLCATKRAHRETPRPEPGNPGVMFRCGKRTAGRLIDGREWNEFPEVPYA